MKFNIPSILLLAGAVSLTACNDFLDKEPDERVALDNEDAIIKLVGTAYTGGDYGWLCEISSDNMIDNNAPHRPANENAEQKEVFFKLSSYGREDEEAFAFEPIKSSTGTDSPSSIWSNAYNAIATANHGLQAIEQMYGNREDGLSAKLKAAKGEALLCRAYHHFLLVNIFSQAYKGDAASSADQGIHYMKSVESTVAPQYDRGTVTETYRLIEADLEEGLSLISDINFNQAPKYHFNKAAAHAFAARFYLFKHDYEKVIAHADSVLGTDREAMIGDLMDFSDFDDCTDTQDYANKWKDPKKKNNLLLIDTASGAWRRCGGYRYACNGIPLRSITYRSGPTWGWTIVPTAMVGGGAFYRGKAEHGLFSAKIAEHFQYSDKVAGIGYVHQIRREFTRTSLLLDRAEAYLLGRHDKDECFADLAAYEKGRQSFSEKTRNQYLAGGNGLKDLTRDMIDKVSGYSNEGWYAKGTDGYPYKGLNLNCYANWEFAANMGVIVAADETPFMNAINDYRRFENAYEGTRFFDVKRWGIEYTHRIGHSSRTQYEDIRLTWNDPRRALEIPQEVIAAGHPASRPAAKTEQNAKDEIEKPLPEPDANN